MAKNLPELDPDANYRQGPIDDQDRHLIQALTNETEAFLHNITSSPFDVREAIEGFLELTEKLVELAEHLKVEEGDR